MGEIIKVVLFVVKEVVMELCQTALYFTQNGGLGIEQNIVTMCMQCHRDYDPSTKRNEVKESY